MNLKLIIQGFIVGIGKIIPGVSGAMLAMFMGIYEDLMEAITCFFHDKKKHFWLLFNFLIGLFIAIVLFSHVILFLLNHYYDVTIYLFLGLITGTMLKFKKNISFTKKNTFIFFLALIIMLFLPFLESDTQYIFQNSFIHYLYVILLGGLDALTSIVPGISGTAIFMMLGSYEFVLSILGNPFSFLFILYGIGMVLGVIITCYLMYYLLKNKKEECNVIILAFAIASILLIFLKVSGSFNLFLLFMMSLGILIGYFCDN